MYRAAAATLSPAPEPGLRTLPLRLAMAVRQEFGPGEHGIDVPDLHRYFTDLTRGHDLGYRNERMAEVRGNTFISMARDVLTGRLSGERIDLAIVAHAAPEFDPRLSAPVNLTAVLPGEPLVFSVSGHGVLAAFSALRVAAGYMRRHGYERVLVLVMDQGSTPYDTPARTGDAATALLFERDGGPSVQVGTVSAMAPADVPAALAALVRAAPMPDTVVTGSGLAGTDHWPTAVSAPDGYPCTGLWAPLADGTVSAPVLLADHDPRHRELGVCVLTGSS